VIATAALAVAGAVAKVIGDWMELSKGKDLSMKVDGRIDALVQVLGQVKI
jgi:hypothetical protein